MVSVAMIFPFSTRAIIARKRTIKTQQKILLEGRKLSHFCAFKQPFLEIFKAKMFIYFFFRVTYPNRFIKLRFAYPFFLKLIKCVSNFEHLIMVRYAKSVYEPSFLHLISKVMSEGG